MLFETITSPYHSRFKKKFWLVFDLPITDKHDTKFAIYNQLAKGVLSGVKGISNSREIMADWFQIARNSCLVMDGDAVVSLNNLEPVRYHDSDHLVANNFAVMMRLYNRNNIVSMFETLFYNIANKMSTEWIGTAEYYGVLNDIREGGYHVNSVKDFHTIIQKHTNKIPYGLLWEAIANMGALYAKEDEWLVHGDLIVPSGSTLLISRNSIVNGMGEWVKNGSNSSDTYANFYQHHMFIEENISKYHLNDKYIIRYINSARFEKSKQNIHFNREKRKLSESALLESNYSQHVNEAVDRIIDSHDSDKHFYIDWRMENGYGPYDDEHDDEATDKDRRDYWKNRVYDAKYNIEYLFKSGYHTCYRVITAPLGWTPSGKMGIYWSWDINAAEAHWGDFSSGHVTWLLEAKIYESNVDWVATLAQNADPDYEDEKEIRILDDTNIELISYKIHH